MISCQNKPELLNMTLKRRVEPPPSTISSDTEQVMRNMGSKVKLEVITAKDGV